MRKTLIYLIAFLVVLSSYQNIKGISVDNSPSSKIIAPILPKISYKFHRPIYIVGDDDFTKENGVVAGNGTKENPYIVEGWKIRANLFLKVLNYLLWKLERSTHLHLRKYILNIALCGIYIKDTTKHVVIRNNYIHGWYGRRSLFPMSGIIIINATNITIENNTFENNFYSIFIPNYLWDSYEFISSDIVIKSNKIREGDVGVRIEPHTYNCSIIYNEISNCEVGGISSCSGTIYIAKNYIHKNGNGIFAGHKNIIENNIIENNGNGIYCFSSGPEDFNGSDALIINNTIVGNLAGIFVSPGHPTILNNTIENNEIGILRFAISKKPIIMMDNIICNNTKSSFDLSYGGPAIVKHNLISYNGDGGTIQGNVTFEYNIVSHNSEGICCGPAELDGNVYIPSIHFNNIYDNGFGLHYIETIWNVTINATYNYWGSPDGSSGYGNGHGDSVDKNIIFEPWLTEPVENAGPRK